MYDEYIRSVVGYPRNAMPNTNDFYNNEYMQMMPNMMNMNANQEAFFSQSNLVHNQNSHQHNTKMMEDCYPKIYMAIYPAVQKACLNNTRPITKESIDEMVNEIFLEINASMETKININLTNTVSSSSGRDSRKDTKLEDKENRGEDRSFRHRGVQDIIKILLIRELLTSPGFFPGRPPHRPGPGRPPFPGGHGRPPHRPRSIYENQFEDLYEY